jgi:hypothetical protein
MADEPFPLTSVSWLGTQMNLHGEPLREFLRQFRRELPIVRIGDTRYVPTAKLHAVAERLAKTAKPASVASLEDISL